MRSDVRVRFAPSPTGFFHIGSARTALFNWLYARHTAGALVLRIEDTDDERDREEFLNVLLDGPYVQSQRGSIYEKYVSVLKESGRAYEKDGAVYFKVSGEPQVIHDLIRGDVVRKEEKDFVIVRSNGKYIFHLVNVVDDMLMKITHVIRGEDHLSNTSKHVELFKAFGVVPPLFAHIPLILKSQGSGKMSKRDTGALIEEYQKNNFLPESVRNYLCLLGWSPKNDREILPINDIIALFDISDVNKNNARFDEKKMAFFNSEYLRNLSAEDFCKISLNVLKEAGMDISSFSEDYARSVFLLCQEKLRLFSELSEFTSYFFTEEFSYDRSILEKLIKKIDVKKRLQEFLEKFSSVEDGFDENAIEDLVHSLSEQNSAPAGEYIHSLRFAVSGRNVGPSLFGMLRVLGKNVVQKRINRLCAQLAN